MIYKNNERGQAFLSGLMLLNDFSIDTAYLVVYTLPHRSVKP